MTRKQRRLIYTWIGFAALFAAWIIFDEWVTNHLRLLRFALLLAMPFVFLFARKPQRPPDLEETAEDHPWVKIWMAICCIGIIGLYVLTTHSSIRLEEVFGSRVVIITFLVTFGPLAVLAGYRRYKEYGEEGDAI